MLPGKSSHTKEMMCAGHGSRGPDANDARPALGMEQTCTKQRASSGCDHGVAKSPRRGSSWAYCRRRHQYGELIVARDGGDGWLRNSGCRCQARDGATPNASDASGCLRRAKRAGVVRLGCDASEGMRSTHVQSYDARLPLRGRIHVGVRDGTYRGSSPVKLEYGRGLPCVIVERRDETRGSPLGRVHSTSPHSTSPQKSFSPQQPPQPKGIMSLQAQRQVRAVRHAKAPVRARSPGHTVVRSAGTAVRFSTTPARLEIRQPRWAWCRRGPASPDDVVATTLGIVRRSNRCR